LKEFNVPKKNVEDFNANLNIINVSEKNIENFKTDFNIINKCGRRLGITIVNFFEKFKKKPNIKEKICILIDQAEMLDFPHKKEGSLVQKIIEIFLPAMSSVVIAKNQNIQWRFIFSGRYISEWDNKITRKNIPLIAYELKLFEPHTIAETIHNYAKEREKKPTYEEVQKIASLTLHFTGGHPKCMVPIIKDGLDELIEDVLNKEKKYYQETMLPVIEDIKEHIPDVYNTAETLSVVRKITRNLLDEFIRTKLVKGYQSKFDIEEKILSTSIFHRNEHFLEDAIIRKILAIHLRHYNASRFKEICQIVISCYLNELIDSESLEPATLAVELLFLELQAYCINDYSKSNAKIYFEKKVNDIIKTIEQNRTKNALEIIEGVKDLLEKDQELKLNLQYLAEAEMGSFIEIIEDKIEKLKI
jgi:hypothetical protein